MELKIEEIKNSLMKYITQERYQHTIGVVDTALKLSKLYGCDQDKATLASLLHDIGRDLPLERMHRLLNNKKYKSLHHPEFVLNNPLLLHAHVGKVLAKEHFGINDREVLKSIELHTTGGPSMSLLDKVLFVADYIEPGRAFKGVKKARFLAFRDIDMACFYIFKSTLKNLLARNLFIFKDTLMGYNEILLKKGSKGSMVSQEEKRNKIVERGV